MTDGRERIGPRQSGTITGSAWAWPRLKIIRVCPAGTVQQPGVAIPSSWLAWPNIVVHQRSRGLGVDFSDGSAFRFSFEFLRVNSPSAEVQGHSPDQAVLQYGKREVLITEIEQVGNYAIRPVFSDGHGSGIYSWDYLYQLGKDQDVLWKDYLAQLEARGLSRDGNAEPPPPKHHGGCGGGGGCGSGGCGG